MILRRSEPLSISVSRRGLLGLTAAVGVGTLMLGGCADLEGAGARFDASEISGKPMVLVATNRKPAGGARAKPWFGTERSPALNVARATIVPPSDSRFSLASVGLEDWRIERMDPAPGVVDLFAQTASARDVLLYVHGFNTTFETAVLDAARISDGIRFHGDTMVFSWPSKAKLLDYAYDRESATWSRDALEQVIEGLMASPGVRRIHIVAHSVGTMLTLEALRQVYAQNGGMVTDRIGAVVFASPDIDMDVFSSSVTRIGAISSNVTVVAATNDRALAVSGWLAGGVTRVGAAEKVKLEALGLRVIDASAEGWGIINHDLFLSNAQIRQVIRRAIDNRA